MKAARSVIRRKSIWAVIIWTALMLVYLPAMTGSLSVQGNPSAAVLGVIAVA
jgi:hypothetical protein